MSAEDCVVGSVRSQEYLLPWEAFELLAVSLGFRPVGRVDGI